MKEFNLEEAKAGKPVCTRDGRKVRILCWDFKISENETKILCAVESITQKNTERTLFVNNRGEFTEGYNNALDLMMQSEKNEGWINILYERQGNYYTPDDRLFESKEKAESKMYKEFQRVATIHIEW